MWSLPRCRYFNRKYFCPLGVIKRDMPSPSESLRCLVPDLASIPDNAVNFMAGPQLLFGGISKGILFRCPRMSPKIPLYVYGYARKS